MFCFGSVLEKSQSLLDIKKLELKQLNLKIFGNFICIQTHTSISTLKSALIKYVENR